MRTLTFPVNHFDRPAKRASTASPWWWWCRLLTDAPVRVGERPSVTAGLEGTRRLGRFLSTACDASSPSWSSSLSRAKSISLSIFRRAARLSRSFSFLLRWLWLLSSSSSLPVVLFLAVEICRPSSSPCEELWRPPRRSDLPFGVERRFLLVLLGSRLCVPPPAMSLGGVCCMGPNNHKERNEPCRRRVRNSVWWHAFRRVNAGKGRQGVVSLVVLCIYYYCTAVITVQQYYCRACQNIPEERSEP